ncbi:hypothetical protein EVAR_78172_1 [Eumeta japonica]|uniref:Uncharacterized protein n=1 Tax=Eumeta variegata TaxID=151549 RepID=A0A4C1UYN2_EUMVA|nr:hypothetical protein EVAR_78172_1 [Eumeta japonica]
MGKNATSLVHVGKDAGVKLVATHAAGSSGRGRAREGPAPARVQKPNGNPVTLYLGHVTSFKQVIRHGRERRPPQWSAVCFRGLM